MSSPYGPPGHPGQQGPGPYGGGQGGAPGWGPGPGGPGPGGPGPAYSGPGSGAPAQWGQGPGTPLPGQGSLPGQGNQSPSGQPPRAKAPKSPVDLGRLIPLAVGGLGVLGFIFGFLPGLKVSDQGTVPVYGTAGYLPILILLAGMLAYAPLLPGGKKYTLATALLSVAGFLGAVTSLTSGISSLVLSSTAGIGLILLLIVGFLQAAAAVYGALLEAGTLKPVAARPPAPPAAPAAPMPSAPPAAFGGYGNQGYAPPAPPAGGYPPQYGPGAASDIEPTTGQHGRDDGPPPDVTQQVRF